MRLFLLPNILLLLSLATRGKAQPSSIVVGNTTKMCAVLKVYKKDPLNCKGKAKKQKTKIDCLSGPGSSCKQDFDGNDLSISDVYCNKDGFHETIHHGTKDCSGGEITQVFYPKDQCAGGHIFVSCEAGPCQREDEEDVVEGLWNVPLITSETQEKEA